MPLFEFVCNYCNNTFEDLVRSNDAIEDVVCPICGNNSVNKKISNIAAKSTASNSYSMAGTNSSSPFCSSGST